MSEWSYVYEFDFNVDGSTFLTIYSSVGAGLLPEIKRYESNGLFPSSTASSITCLKRRQRITEPIVLDNVYVKRIEKSSWLINNNRYIDHVRVDSTRTQCPNNGLIQIVKIQCAAAISLHSRTCHYGGVVFVSPRPVSIFSCAFIFPL